MGLIADALEDADAPTGGQPENADADRDGDSGPYLSRDQTTGTIDPFLTVFDGEHIMLGEEQADRLLSLLVVISNVFG